MCLDVLNIVINCEWTNFNKQMNCVQMKQKFFEAKYFTFIENENDILDILHLCYLLHIFLSILIKAIK